MFHLADIGIVMVTMVGGTHVFCRRLDEAVILDLIEREGVSHVFTVPAVIDRLAKHPRAGRADLSSLKLLGYGGSPMPAGVYEVARRTFPTVDFVQGFGMTEMSAHTFLAPKHHRPDADPERLKSAGQVCYGYELKIVDDAGQELPRGQTGELVGRGDNLMMGYWNRPEETRQALRDGWMHTGDVGYMDADGFVYITDRAKDMIVTGAENVYSIEVESVISRHPAVDECAVIGVPDDRWGERVHAIVVLKSGGALTLDDLQAYLQNQLAGYKRPRSLDIRTSPLPRGAAGKILKRSLREPYWAEFERAV
jgi:long-chain acyl-CoA synthetase